MQVLDTTKKQLWRWLARRMNMRYQLECGLQIDVVNYSDWLTLCEVFVSQEYARVIEPVAAACRTGSGRCVVLDLGANCGYFTAFLCEQLSRSHVEAPVHFVMVEADPKLARELASRMPAQSGSFTFDVRHGLAGKREGVANFDVDYKDNGSHVRGVGVPSSTVRTVQCRYLDLDTLLEPTDTIVCLKIDIEGSEFDLICEYPKLLSRAHCLAIEFHNGSGSTDKALLDLRALGFERPVACKITPETQTYVLARADEFSSVVAIHA